MKEMESDIVKDLDLLVDISCQGFKRPEVFERFHRMLVRMAYKATDVAIDYEQKLVNMKVLAEDESYDAMMVNDFAETVFVSMKFDDLNTFLKSCLAKETDVLKLYYPFLLSEFQKH